jgi:hypothetical protein
VWSGWSGKRALKTLLSCDWILSGSLLSERATMLRGDDQWR